MNPGSPDYEAGLYPLDPDVRRLRSTAWRVFKATCRLVRSGLAVPDQTASCTDCNTRLYVKKMRVFAADKGRGQSDQFLLSRFMPTSYFSV